MFLSIYTRTLVLKQISEVEQMYIFKGREGGQDKRLTTNVIPKFPAEGLTRKMRLWLWFDQMNAFIIYILQADMLTFFPSDSNEEDK